MNDTETAQKQPARIVAGPPRTATYVLTWPVEYDGKTWTEITISRLTAQQVDDFVQAIRAGNENARLPLFDAPAEVLDAMDADDSTNLNEAARPFTPAALRAPAASEAAATSSATSPAT